MAEDEIDKTTVFDAAEALVAAGEAPRLTAIAEQLDAAPAALLPALTEWRIRKAIQTDGADPWGEIVAALDPLAADAEAIAAAAPREDSGLAARAGELARELSEVQARADAAEATRAEAEAERDAARAEAATARETAAAALDRAEALEGDLANVANDGAAYETSQNEAAQLAATLRAANERVGETIRARDSALAQVKREQIRASEAEQELERLQRLSDETAETLADAMEARLAAETDGDSLREKLEALQAQLDDVNEREIAAREELDRLRAAGGDGAPSPEMDWTLGAEEWPELPRQLAIATARIAALRAERDALRAHLDDARQQIDALNGLLEIRLSSPTTIVQTGGGEMQAVGGAPNAPAANSGGRARLSIVRK